MKKIFIASFDLEIGGVERSLIGLLNEIDYTQYDVDLFLYAHEGEFMDMIPKQVHLLPEIPQYRTYGKPLTQILLSRYFYMCIPRTVSKIIARLLHKKNSGEKGYRQIQYDRIIGLPFLPRIGGEYDVAISYVWPHHYLFGSKIKAKKTIGWIHTDYKSISLSKRIDSKMWGTLDHIVSVSEDCQKSFLSIFPHYQHKVAVMENLLSHQIILQQADADVSAEMPKENGVIKICTVGRFCYAKAFDNAVLLCKKIMDAGVKIKWYAIGFGEDEGLIKAKIAETGMGEHFIILGKKTNPYPYMKACDIYVQPSRYEGKSVTVREAQMLCKPVVITNFATASSQVKHNVDGIILPLDIDEFTQEFVALIRDKETIERLKANLSKMDYGNYSEVSKFYELLQ